MFRTVIVAALAFAALSAAPASAVTTVVTFSPASCAVACGNGTDILQSIGDTAGVDVSYRATTGIGNTSTAEPFLRYWTSAYSGSPAAYAGTGWGEVRFDTLSSGTLTLDSVDLGGWPNTPRNIDVRVYDLSYTLLTSATFLTTPAALLTVNFGQSSTSGLIFQFGQDGFNGGIQNITYTFTAGNVVPEPASWMLLIAGFGLTGAAMRRRAILA